VAETVPGATSKPIVTGGGWTEKAAPAPDRRDPGRMPKPRNLREMINQMVWRMLNLFLKS
jgi:hypothetical protein